MATGGTVSVSAGLSASAMAKLIVLRKLIATSDKRVRGEMRKEVGSRLRKTVGPKLRIMAKESALGTKYGKHFPSGGGLNRRIAKSRGSIAVRYSGRTTGIKFTMSQRNKTGKDMDLNRANAGVIRHPFWGKWPQPAAKYIEKTLQRKGVTPGWFDVLDDPAKEAALIEVNAILGDVIAKIERGWK